MYLLPDVKHLDNIAVISTFSSFHAEIGCAVNLDLARVFEMHASACLQTVGVKRTEGFFTYRF